MPKLHEELLDSETFQITNFHERGKRRNAVVAAFAVAFVAAVDEEFIVAVATAAALISPSAALRPSLLLLLLNIR